MQSQRMKNVRIQSFSGPYFPAFGLYTEIYSVNLRIQSESGKIRTRKTPIFTQCFARLRAFEGAKSWKNQKLIDHFWKFIVYSINFVNDFGFEGLSQNWKFLGGANALIFNKVGAKQKKLDFFLCAIFLTFLKNWSKASAPSSYGSYGIVANTQYGVNKSL